MCLTIVITGCGKRNQLQKPPPPTVTIAQPLIKDVVEWAEFTANTKATATVELRCRVKGYLQKIAFVDGALVKKGDLLFVIEKAPFIAAVEAADANLAKSTAELQLAEANLKRTSQLVEQQAVSRQQMDEYNSQVAIAQANERASRANVTQANLDLSYTEIHSPIDGRIGRTLIDAGNLVLPDSTLLAVVETIDPIHAYFSVSERDMLRFMKMRRDHTLPDPEEKPPVIYLGLPDSDDFPFQGKLDYLEFGIDPATGTTQRRSIFENKSLQLVPGMFVRVRGSLGAPQPRVLVEERAISSDQRGEFVLVVDDKNIVQYRPVKLGTKVEGRRVVMEGVEKDDWVIVNGLQRARPQAVVNPTKQGEQKKAGATAPASNSTSTPEPEKQTAPEQPAPEQSPPKENPKAEKSRTKKSLVSAEKYQGHALFFPPAPDAK
jgi:RND family efflux transporter MFP subunit